MAELWAEELTEEQTEALIDKMANEICKRKMQTPAIMMLEMHKPVASFAAQASVVFAPFAIPFVGFDMFNDYSRLASKRENVERLLLRIEELTRAESNAAPDSKDD